MALVFRVIGYLSLLILLISFYFMVRTLRRGRKVTRRSLIIPILMSVLFLVVYGAVLNHPEPSVLSALLMALGLVFGVIWSRATTLTARGTDVYGRRSVGYVVIWGLSIAVTQAATLMAPSWAAYGMSTIYFSTGLAMGTNASLLIKRSRLLSDHSQGRLVAGAGQAVLSRCKRCGEISESGQRFCVNCGSQLRI